MIYGDDVCDCGHLISEHQRKGDGAEMCVACHDSGRTCERTPEETRDREYAWFAAHDRAPLVEYWKERGL